jgi:hypothetical protein
MSVPCTHGQQSLDIGRPNPAAERLAQQELALMLKKKLSGQPEAVIERAAGEFVQHLHETSPIIAENLLAGRLGEDDLSSRLDVFIGDHPELSGRPALVSSVGPRQLVVELLAGAPDLAHTDAERQALADRFIERLGTLSGTARNDLLAGRLARDELQSRVSVFISDLRAEASRSATDPAIAAAIPIVDAYIKANFGSATDRIESMCMRGTTEEATKVRDFVLFRMRPNLLRIHVVQDGLVVGVMGFDGSSAWLQSPGKPPVPAAGRQAEVIARTSRFDDPLVVFRERGSEVRIEERPAVGPIKIHIKEPDGGEMVSSIDPVTYTQVSLRTRLSDGKWLEARFGDYRKVGATNIAYLVQEFEDGALRSTTRYTEVTADVGLIDHFFAHPRFMAFDYMDFMGGLAVLDARDKKAAANAPQIKITQ